MTLFVQQDVALSKLALLAYDDLETVYRSVAFEWHQCAAGVGGGSESR
jgi:hypothetical protein